MTWTILAAALAFGWAWLHRPLVGWALEGWQADDGPIQAFLAVLLLGRVLRATDPRAVLARLERPPAADPVAVALAAGAPIVGALLYRRIPLDVVLAGSAVLSALGLVGLYLPIARSRAVAVAILGGLLLPVTDHLDVLVGWPLRRLTAAVAADVLGVVGPAVAVETVLRVEGGIAHVDLPCAGVRSLWSLAAVFLGATVVGDRRIDLGWVVVGAVAAAALVVGNVGRVTIVVGVAHVLGWPLVADVIHQPLGLVAFVVAAGIALVGLSWRPEPPIAPTAGPVGRWIPGVVLPALIVAGWLARSGPAARPTAPPVLPDDVVAIDATEAERRFVAEHGGAIAKGRTDRGTVVLVAARSWVAHHAPELCLEADGFAIREDRPAWIDGAPLRIASASRDGTVATAIWWLQSADAITDDPVVRIRDGLASDRAWVLVSALLDGAVDPADPELASLVRDLRAAAAASLEGT